MPGALLIHVITRHSGCVESFRPVACTGPRGLKWQPGTTSILDARMHYVVDRANLIIDVDEGWDAQAVQVQGGLDSVRAKVIGQPLEAFMVGDATKMFVRAALDAARLLRQTRVLPYRCDTVGLLRRFEMVISPLDDGCVRVAHELVEARPIEIRRKEPRSRGLVGCRCSQCLRVRLNGGNRWMELELEPQALLAQDICPRCARRLFETSATASHAGDDGGDER
jgi:hypothetical protein